MLWLFSFTLADNGDCGIFAIWYYNQPSANKNWFSIVNQSRWTNQNPYSNFLTIDQQLSIIDTDSLNTALLNLKKYCCKNNLWWLSANFKQCKDDNVFFNNNALDSPYLFDHIFDVIIRRLNGISWDATIYTKTNMTVDDKWAERRNRINEKAENISWANPQLIIDKYQEIWSMNKEYDISDNVDRKFWADSNINFLKYISGLWESQESKDIAESLRNYDKRSLFDRYNNACALSEYFYSLFSLGQSSNDRIKTINMIAKWTCKNAVSNQISNENRYVQLVIQKSAYLFLNIYMQSYMNYLQNRSETLKSTRKNTTDRFLDVVRAVPQLIRSCVK